MIAVFPGPTAADPAAAAIERAAAAIRLAPVVDTSHDEELARRLAAGALQCIE